MIIKNIKINGISEPVGYDFSNLSISYEIECDKNIKAEPILYIFDGKTLVHNQQLDYKQSYCSPVDFSPSLEKRYTVKIACGDVEGVSYFETGTEFDCPFVTPIEAFANPVIFKNFATAEIGKKISAARLYVTGLGLYRAFINSQRVGNEYLTPYCNDYDAYVQYQTYDVTDMLMKNNNMEIALSDGWYKGRFGLRKKESIYGDTYTAAAKLVITYEDGMRQEIKTDESWKARQSSIVFSNIYDGEIADESKTEKAECGVKLLDKAFNTVPRVSLPVIVKQQLKPELYVSPNGEKILDFKQNFSGIVSFKSSLKAGQTVKLTVGEALQEECFYRDNLRTAKAEFIYTSDGVEKQVEPMFTFYGFRYCLLEGFESVNAGDFVGKVLYSDLPQTVKINTDNDKINRLLENCMWGQRSNFVDVPTDCPQRDERLGWTGDAQVFSRAACFQMYCKAFYKKYLKDMAIDQQLLGGRIATYSPSMKELSAAYCAWEDAATIIPWNLYEFYGDLDLLREHFYVIEGFVNTLIEMDSKHGGGRLYNFGFHLGDWLAQDGVSPTALRGATDEHFIASIYYYNSVRIAADAAKALGFTDKYQRFTKIDQEIYAAVVTEYFSHTGRLAIDTQTGYTLSLAFGVYKDKTRVIEGFKNRLKRDNYKIKGGFVGATRLIQTLFDNKLVDEAFRILYSEEYPGWLYCVNLGATTIWERWNSILPDGKISGTGMNSLNHYAYGAVAEAFYSNIAGLKPMTAGFKEVTIAPVFNYRLKKFDFEFNSPSGVYAVRYSIGKDGKTELCVRVPFGATANLKIEGSDLAPQTLSGGEHIFALQLSVSVCRPFSINTPISELISSPKVAELFKHIVPPIYYFLSSQDIGIGGEPLSFITQLESVNLPPEAVAALDAKLRAIEV